MTVNYSLYICFHVNLLGPWLEINEYQNLIFLMTLNTDRTTEGQFQNIRLSKRFTIQIASSTTSE